MVPPPDPGERLLPVVDDRQDEATLPASRARRTAGGVRRTAGALVRRERRRAGVVRCERRGGHAFGRWIHDRMPAFLESPNVEAWLSRRARGGRDDGDGVAVFGRRTGCRAGQQDAQQFAERGEPTLTRFEGFRVRFVGTKSGQSWPLRSHLGQAAVVGRNCTTSCPPSGCLANALLCKRGRFTFES